MKIAAIHDSQYKYCFTFEYSEKMEWYCKSLNKSKLVIFYDNDVWKFNELSVIDEIKKSFPLVAIDEEVEMDKVLGEVVTCPFVLRDYQKDAVDEGVKFMMSKEKKGGLLVLPTGCLSGDTIINFNKGGLGRPAKLEMAFRHYNQLSSSNRNWKRIDNVMVRSLLDDRIGLNKVENILYSGRKKTIKIKLKNKKSLVLTPEHLLFSEKGWVRADKALGENIAFDYSLRARKGNKKRVKHHDNSTFVGENHPYAVEKIDKRGKIPHNYYVIEKHRALYEMKINNFSSLDDYRKAIVAGDKLLFIDPKKYHIHHGDLDHYNNSLDNLECLSAKDHLLLHSEKCKKNFNQGIVKYSKCISIEDQGVVDTYDIVCKDPYNNFVANGIIVHNSGKSLVIASIAQNLPGKTIVLQPTKEILEQNHQKAISFGFKNIGVFSASMGRKDLGKLTFATIGTIISKKEFFLDFTNLIIDEAHLCNAKGGQYDEFIKFFGGKCLGLSVFHDSIISLRGGVFEEGFVGEIEDAFDLLLQNGYKIDFYKNIEIMNIENLNIFSRGWDGKNFSWKKCKRLIRHSGKDSDCLSMKTRTGDLKLTYNHSVYVANNDIKHRIKYVNSSSYKYTCKMDCPESKDLKKADILFGDDGYSWANNENFKSEISDYAYLVGYYLGNGWIDGSRFGFSLHKNFCDNLIENFKKNGLNNVNFRIQTRETQKNSVEVRFSSTNLVKIFGKYGLKKKSYEKFIPGEALLSWGKRDRLLLLSGLIDSDGHLSERENEKKRYYYITTSIKLANTLIVLLQSLGVPASLHKRKCHKKGGIIRGRQIYNRRQSYCVNWSWYSQNGKGLGHKGIRKKFIQNNFIETPIKGVSHIGKTDKYLYDIEMCGHPSFVANGILVHNTATPYRLHSYNDIRTGDRTVVAKFLTRTNPKIFSTILHVTQIEDLYKKGFLCPVRYEFNSDYDQSQIKLNSTKMDFDERSLAAYNEKMGVVGITAKTIKSRGSKHVLVFASSVDEATLLGQELRDSGIKAVVISAKTPKLEREQILADFRSGKIQAVTNVGVLTTGFDFPELDCIILARPTQSVALYYQMCGRGIRVIDGKPSVKIIDVCGNVGKFGRIETFEIVPSATGVRLRSNVGFLTGVNFAEGDRVDLEAKNYQGVEESTGYTSDMINFGKYKGAHITKVPTHYLEWAATSFGEGEMKRKFQRELLRRAN